MLKAMLVLAFLGLLLMSEEKAKKFDTEGIKPPVFALIIVTWSNEINVDVDLHLRCPTGEMVNYVRREACFANLERDARGKTSDWSIVDGKRVEVVNNREVVSFRNPVPGEWFVSVHWYNGQHPDPVAVRIEIIRLEPSVQTVFTREVVLKKPFSEESVVRFQMNPDRSLSQFDHDHPRLLLKPTVNNNRRPSGEQPTQ